MFHQKKKSTPIPSKRQEHTMDPQPPSPCTSQSSAFSQQTPSPFVLSVTFKKRPRDISITPSPEPDKRPRLQHKERKPQPSSPCESVSPTSSPLYTPRKIPLTPSQTCKKNDYVALTKLRILTPKRDRKGKFFKQHHQDAKNDNVALTKLRLLTQKRDRIYHQYHHLIPPLILR